MVKWTGPAVARGLAAEVLGEGFTVRKGTCAFPGELTSELTVKAAKASVLEPGRGHVDFPGVEVLVDVSADYPDRAVEEFGQFGFRFSLRTALRSERKGPPAPGQYRTDGGGDGLPPELVEDVRRLRPLLVLTTGEVVELMATREDRLRFGPIDLTVYVRDTERRLVKAYLMARRFGLTGTARQVVDEFRAGRPKARLTEERLELVREFTWGGFDLSELSAALTTG
ncbi:hypothetical protein ACIRBX_00695 [Kitasatospora sp. NPDC096147]|uniref:hypothetical protein n=1 Tax=Kitasatospora sp. NPDC096147 TaxID=3364093 RepID=UPI0037F78AA9